MTSNRAVTRCAVITLMMLTGLAAVSDTKVPDEKRMRRSDDVNVVSLQTVVEQQASVIQTLQAKVTALENSLQTQLTSQHTKDTALENSLQAQLTSQHTKVTSLENSLQAQLTSQRTKDTSMENSLRALQTRVDATSSTVAFSARFSGDQDDVANGVSLGQHQTLVFNEAVTNVGNAYSTHTGIFTAPIAGTYAFFLSVMSTNLRAAIHLAISKNGATLDLVYAEGKTDHADQGSSLVSTHLVKGDRVWVRQTDGDAVRASWYTVFTGYLLQAQ